jgi:hypothetical protein
VAKLTIEQERRHARACQLVNLSRDLTEDERGYVLDHYQPSSTGRSALNRAHFTPEGLAVDMSVHIGGSRIVDLAAGIGRLSFHNRDPWARNSPDFVCIEREPEFVRIGRRVMPEAWWICADIMDIPRLLGRLGKFDCAISNPPFGPVLRSGDAPGGYRGRRFEYHAIALASLIARRGVFLVPQAAAPFRYSGVNQFQHDTGDAEYRKYELGHYQPSTATYARRLEQSTLTPGESIMSEPSPSTPATGGTPPTQGSPSDEYPNRSLLREVTTLGDLRALLPFLDGDRAVFAAAGAIAHAACSGQHDNEELTVVVTDLCADLLHLADALGIDHAELTANSQSYYLDELGR